MFLLPDTRDYLSLEIYMTVNVVYSSYFPSYQNHLEVCQNKFETLLITYCYKNCKYINVTQK